MWPTPHFKLLGERVHSHLQVQVTEASTVVLAGSKGPLIKLDDKHYKLVDKMEALTEATPSLINADSLTVKGPVRFVAGTSFQGDVLVSNGAPSCCT
jgi:UTP--glucose-1-phosphate uridylyltransferase/phosphoglucomutase